ncbi:hypothetical protein ACQP2P_29140 [Dactylosporangium sp. CA-139114]|uniref:hypothetical protein n=1 Tax=Dactylosporangium sp. CA-139114 TaxID=3239931 RepID=UPI003D95C34E
MSDYDMGDTGYGDSGHDVDFGHYEAGQEQGSLDQMHHAAGSETDASSQFGVYEEGHHDTDSTDFSQGHHVEYDAPAAVHYESDDYTNYSHDATSDDHVFAAEGSENAHQAQFSELDQLENSFGKSFVDGTEFHSAGGGQFGVAAN